MGHKWILFLSSIIIQLRIKESNFFLCIHSISKPEGVIKGRNQIVGSEGMLRRVPTNANLCQANLMHNDVKP